MIQAQQPRAMIKEYLGTRVQAATLIHGPQPWLAETLMVAQSFPLFRNRDAIFQR